MGRGQEREVRGKAASGGERRTASRAAAGGGRGREAQKETDEGSQVRGGAAGP